MRVGIDHLTDAEILEADSIIVVLDGQEEGEWISGQDSLPRAVAPGSPSIEIKSLQVAVRDDAEKQELISRVGTIRKAR
jgi:hypothetical protein